MADKSPDAFRTISEVADWLGVQPHVLRFWESKFSQVKPVKRAGGRRYYRPNDMLLLGGIRKLLHEDGLTIKGAQKVLREEGMAHVAAMSRPLEEDVPEAPDIDIRAEPAEAPVIEPSVVESSVVESSVVESSVVEAPFVEAPIVEAPFVEVPVEEAEPVAAFEPPAQTEPEMPPVADPAPLQEVTPEGAEAIPAPDIESPLPETDPAPFGTANEDSTTDPQDDTEETTIIHTDPEPLLDAGPVETSGSAPAFEDFEASDTIIPSSPAPEADAQVQDELFPETVAPAAEAALPDARDEGNTDDPIPETIDAIQDASARQPDADDAQAPVDMPEPLAAPETVAEPETATAQPQIVDAPDPDESTLNAAPTALSHVFSATTLDAATRAQVTPLVSQLAALRDRMAAARAQ